MWTWVEPNVDDGLIAWMELEIPAATFRRTILALDFCPCSTLAHHRGRLGPPPALCRDRPAYNSGRYFGCLDLWHNFRGAMWSALLPRDRLGPPPALYRDRPAYNYGRYFACRTMCDVCLGKDLREPHELVTANHLLEPF